MHKLKAIDLFAGAGGLSHGFMQTGLVSIVAAIEINKHAQSTYKANHDGVALFSDINKVNYSAILAKYGEIDLVIGGPPCQGFSNANRQKSDLISGNNQLVKAFVKSIEATHPKAFVMENVKSMISHTHKFFVSRKDADELDALGIKRTTENFAIGRYTAICRELIDLINSDADLRTYLLPQHLFSKLCSVNRASTDTQKMSDYLHKNGIYFAKLLVNWRGYHQAYWSPPYRNLWMEIGRLLKNWYDGTDVQLDKLTSAIFTVTETQRVIRKINETREHRVDVLNVSCQNDAVVLRVDTYNVFDYVVKKLESFGYEVNHGVLNAAEFGVPQTRGRLFIIGVREDQLKAPCVDLPKGFLTDRSKQYTIGQAIRDLEGLVTSTESGASPIERNGFPITNNLQNLLCNSHQIHNHVTTASSEIALERFASLEPGQNFHNLSSRHKSTYSNAERTQNTIYHRLDYSKTSKAVCNVRKSMWIHPVLNRAISVREAARLQSFPDDFIFMGTKDLMYQQIANAVPPILAQAVAEQVLYLLGFPSTASIREVLLGGNTKTTKEIEHMEKVSGMM